MGRRNHVLDGGPALLRDVAMATNFGMQFAISGFEGYNFGCMTASNMQFDCRGRFSESNYPMKTWPRSSVKGSLPWQPFFGLKLLLTGFVSTTATTQFVMKDGLSGRPTECTYCRYLHIRDVAMANTFCFSVV